MTEKPLEAMSKIKAEEALKEKTWKNISHRSSLQRPVLKWAGLACAAVCVMIAITIFRPLQTEAYSYITLDINPSLELILDQKDGVMQVKAYNKEAQETLSFVDMVGLHYQEALAELMNTEVYQQYFKQESLLQISIYSKDEKRSLEIEQNLCDYLNDTKMKDRYSCHCIDETTHQEASSHHMSGGKYEMIKKIMNLDSAYSIEELEGLSMAQLRDIYNALSDEPLSSKEHHQRHRNH